jgi:hypothetical protein
MTKPRGFILDPSMLPREPDAAALPRHLTRKQAAAVVSKWFFPLSPRTLERADLPYIRFAGSPALIETAALLDWAQARLAAAARLTGGRAIAR